MMSIDLLSTIKSSFDIHIKITELYVSIKVTHRVDKSPKQSLFFQAELQAVISILTAITSNSK